MSKGFRPATIALALASAMQVSAAQAITTTKLSIAGNSDKKQTNATTAPPVIPWSGFQTDAERIARALEVRNVREGDIAEKTRADQNLSAQQKMADAAHATVIVASVEAFITLVGVILVGWTLYHTKRAADEAKRAADAAHKQIAITTTASEDQLRPYVHVSGMRYFFEAQGPNGKHATAEITNGGQTPATYVEIGAVCRAAKPDQLDRMVPSNIEYTSWSAVGRQPITARFVPAQIQDAVTTCFGDQTRETKLFIIGKIKYADVFGCEYESEFIYFVSGVPGYDTSGIQMSRATGKLSTFRITKSPDIEVTAT
ncbi:MAG TPA: hypothetical protein VHC42_07960 [Rhizomicrobium sp.]|nr:hypothetical protein [Rhizomicrobium sp.]